MKFVISGKQRSTLMSHLDSHLRADANADETAYYPIVSLYYDNDDRDCYWEKIRGFSNRRKFRVRVYGSLDGKLPPTVFIEVKHKQDGRGVKRRVRMSLEDAMRVGTGQWPVNPVAEVDKATVREIVENLVIHRGFKPALMMRYDRRAYAAVDPTSDLRITYDTGIAYRLNNLYPVPDDRAFPPENYMYDEDISVLEVKMTGTIPYWLSKLIPECGCKLQSHSKYCNALERSDPVLRSMLAPNWRKPMPTAGNVELEGMNGTESGAIISTPTAEPVVG
jgi:hypothetical protein